MGILKYVDKKNAEILKKKQAKDKKKSEIIKKIEGLEKKVNEELENVEVVLKNEAKIKILKNKLRKIEEETPIEGLDKKYIIEEIEKEVSKLSIDLEKKGKERLKKIYELFEEIVIYEKIAEKEHSKLKDILRTNDITDDGIRDLYFNPYRVKNEGGYVTIDKKMGRGIEYKMVLQRSDFK